MLNRHRKLRMEQMEAREMMAGDVTASVVNGSLYLTEAAGQTNRDNAVRSPKSRLATFASPATSRPPMARSARSMAPTTRTSPSSEAWISSLPEAAISLCSTRPRHHRF